MTTFAISQLDEPDFVAYLAFLHPAQTCAISQTPCQGPICWFLTVEHDLDEGQDLFIARQVPADSWGVYLWEREAATRLCDLPEWAIRAERIADSFSPAQLPVPASWLLAKLTEEESRWHPKRAARSPASRRPRRKVGSIGASESQGVRKSAPHGSPPRLRARIRKSASKQT